MGVGRGIDKLEFELAGFADKLLQALDVLNTGDLYDDASAALAVDNGLGGTELIDTPPDRLDRGLDRRIQALGEPGVGHGQGDTPVTAARDVEVIGREAGEHAAANLDGDLAQIREGLIEISAFADVHRYIARGHILPEVGIADAGAAKRVTDIAADGVEPIVEQILLVDLIEEMGAALQVKAEIDLLVWKPSRHAGHGRGREQIREREQESGEHDAEYQDPLPPLEIHHDRLRLREILAR